MRSYKECLDLQKQSQPDLSGEDSQTFLPT